MSTAPRMEWAAYRKIAEDLYTPMRALSAAIEAGTLEHSLLELVKIRASQINGCAFCIQIHASVARRIGVTEDKLQLLAAWREAPQFSDRERAALAWCEALTHIAKAGAPDPLYDEARRHFNERELAELTAAIALINAWNRIGVAFRFTPEFPLSA